MAATTRARRSRSPRPGARSLGDLAVREVMTTPVVRLREEASIEEALETLEDTGATGAPVVDASDRVIGVFSVHDAARPEHVRKGRIDPQAPGFYTLDVPRGEEEEEDPDLSEPEGYSPEVIGRAAVRDWMSPRVVSASPSTRLGRACQLMLREGIHRVLVIERGKCVGLVSSIDVVRLVAGGA